MACVHNLKALIRALIKIENVYLNKRMEMGSFRFGSHAAEKKVSLLFNLTKKTVSAALMESLHWNERGAGGSLCVWSRELSSVVWLPCGAFL